MSRTMLIFGIIFTILSVFISYYVINKTQAQADILRKEISMHEDTINSSWKQQQEIEQRHAISIMLYALVIDRDLDDLARKVANNYVTDTMSYHNISIDQDGYGGIKFLPAKLKDLKSKTIDNINDLYTKKLTLESDMMDIQRTGEIYKAVGLLLQVIGLILVLYFKP